MTFQKVVCFILVQLVCSIPLKSLGSEELTYEKLANDPYTDHVRYFRKIFEKVNIPSFLEFGLGNGTKYFLDHCEKVTSCEILLPSQSDGWFRHTFEMFSKANNWVPLLKNTTPGMQRADAMARDEKKDPALYDASYLLELKDLCDELFAVNSFDMVFVDPGIHCRGDLVNELFQRAAIIVAHDTGYGSKEYGWYKIQTPSNYEKITFMEGCGTTFWVRKDRTEVIHALQGYLRAENTRHLRIFFPNMHNGLFKSMAIALHKLGHTLVAPDDSFDVKSSSKGPKIHYFEKSVSYPAYPVEIINNKEIFNNPPDVVVLNCIEEEADILRLWKALRKSGKPVKLVHLSGNSDTKFSPKFVKNLIAIDAFTGERFQKTAPNIISWIPWIDFDSLPFNGPSDELALNSFLALQYSRGFPMGREMYQKILDGCQKDFPFIQVRLPGYIASDRMYSMMENSLATLHVKEFEGFGYTIIESLAKGKPVFLKRSFSLGKRLMNWCIEGETAFFFDDYEEFKMKLQAYLADNTLRRQAQQNCAMTIRRMIENEKQLLILDNFLKNLL